MSIGVPVKLLHECKHHIVTVELKNNEYYRGYLVDAEDSMNCRLDNCQKTSKDGKKYYFDHIYIRGSHIRFIICPDMFKNSPMFQRIRQTAKEKNAALIRYKERKIRDQLMIAHKPE